jgi:hypothetical protein
LDLIAAVCVHFSATQATTDGAEEEKKAIHFKLKLRIEDRRYLKDCRPHMSSLHHQRDLTLQKKGIQGLWVESQATKLETTTE